jgi:hypothetical protein
VGRLRGTGRHSCSPTDRSDEVATACCGNDGQDSPDDDAPTVCSPDCADVFLPFIDACGDVLGADRTATFVAVLAMCEVTSTQQSTSLARQLLLSCVDGSEDRDCIPIQHLKVSFNVQCLFQQSGHSRALLQLLAVGPLS